MKKTTTKTAPNPVKTTSCGSAVRTTQGTTSSPALSRAGGSPLQPPALFCPSHDLSRRASCEDSRHANTHPNTHPDVAAAVTCAVSNMTPTFLSWAQRILPSDVDAHDVMQEAAQKAWRAQDQLHDPESAHSWVRQIAKNTVIDALRHTQRRRQHETLAESVDESSLSLDFALSLPATNRTSTTVEQPCDCIFAQMMQLRPTYREILVLVDVQGKTPAEAAAHLQIAANAAYVRLHRARTALRLQLQKHCGTTSTQSCQNCGCVERGCCPRPQGLGNL